MTDALRLRLTFQKNVFSDLICSGSGAHLFSLTPKALYLTVIYSYVIWAKESEPVNEKSVQKSDKLKKGTNMDKAENRHFLYVFLAWTLSAWIPALQRRRLRGLQPPRC